MFSSSSTRITCLGFDGVQSYLQECLGSLTADYGKAIEKSVKRFTHFEVIDEDLHWNAGASEDQRSTDHVWIVRNDLFSVHQPLPTLTSKSTMYTGLTMK
jgi:hypothetical protein